jgi:3-dehydroquinate synthase
MLPKHIIIQSGPAHLQQGFLTSQKYTQVAVLMDEHTQSDCYPLLATALPIHQTIIVPAGEEFKNLDTCTKVWQKLTDLAFDRHSLLIILGGGVLGDLGGFCASTYKRGIDFILIPTTLLSQVDASVGGKLGIDFQHYKNHIGVFQEPVYTLIVSDFLKTLPERELRSGFAEVIKHCLISDKEMWQKVSAKAMEKQSWDELIRHSVSFKYSVIAKDPKERGLRKILNFGHTIGHAVESYLLASVDRIFHGEAIAVGMVTESFIAYEKGLIAQSELDQITAYVLKVFGKVSLPAHDQLMPVIGQDKKNKGGSILMALPKGIGSAIWDIETSEGEIKGSLDYYRSRQI